MLRLATFLLCWLTCATLYYHLTKPNFRLATPEFFYVCAHKLGDTPNDPPAHTLTKIRQNPSVYRLCNTPQQWQSSDIYTNYMRLELSQNSDGSWYLKQWSDSMGDPIELVYRLDDGVITPLLYRTGTQLTRALAIFFGLFVGLGLNNIFWWLWRKYRQPTPKQSAQGADTT